MKTDKDENNHIDLNLKSYIKVYKNRVSKKISDKIVNDLSLIDNFEQHTFYDAQAKELINLSGDQELDVLYNNYYKNNELNDIIWNTIRDYHKDLNFDWMPSWNGYSFPRWNRYSENKKMALHCDRIKSLFLGENTGDPTLSVLGILHNEYTGGDLIMHNEVLQNYEAGDIVVFPSNFLYPHKVEPVLSGCRYSFISWTW